ncbi:hypothetical protein GCM10008939_05030 [Deinococcus aquiradiocola]|uniref:Uncharacterized protein n=1 Tax=Deinococcus aquiradiocola TaxID=393059 RepID=A0A917P6S6_9DEIO|nr:hypothetical protein GCM10008939_05030 [Deinococcus aquiradiocola]
MDSVFVVVMPSGYGAPVLATFVDAQGTFTASGHPEAQAGKRQQNETGPTRGPVVLRSRQRPVRTAREGQDYLLGTVILPAMIWALTDSTFATWALVMRALLYWSIA